jgi:hypothetical protein
MLANQLDLPLNSAGDGSLTLDYQEGIYTLLHCFSIAIYNGVTPSTDIVCRGLSQILSNRRMRLKTFLGICYLLSVAPYKRTRAEMQKHLNLHGVPPSMIEDALAHMDTMLEHAMNTSLNGWWVWHYDTDSIHGLSQSDIPTSQHEAGTIRLKVLRTLGN